ncbi:MAG: hypothetical protein ACI90V_002061 [Bacillariaceae sp.]|jgi:hypothetical protein
MKEKSAKINHFLLQEQFPDIIKAAGSDKRSSSNGGSKFSSASTGSNGSNSALHSSSPFTKHSVSRRVVTAVDHVTQLRLESCRCPHLQEYLPRILDLTLCRTTANQNNPQLSNPVHALHMIASQQSGKDPSSSFSSSASSTSSSSRTTQKQRLPPTFMYGEEHQRTNALQTEGIAEYWCSFDGNSAESTSRTHHQSQNAALSCNISAPSSKVIAKSEPTLILKATTTTVDPTRSGPSQGSTSSADVTTTVGSPTHTLPESVITSSDLIEKTESAVTDKGNSDSTTHIVSSELNQQQIDPINSKIMPLLNTSATTITTTDQHTTNTITELSPSDPTSNLAESNASITTCTSYPKAAAETPATDTAAKGTTSTSASKILPNLTESHLTSATKTTTEIGAADIKPVLSTVKKVITITNSDKDEEKSKTDATPQTIAPITEEDTVPSGSDKVVDKDEEKSKTDATPQTIAPITQEDTVPSGSDKVAETKLSVDETTNSSDKSKKEAENLTKVDTNPHSSTTELGTTPPRSSMTDPVSVNNKPEKETLVISEEIKAHDIISNETIETKISIETERNLLSATSKPNNEDSPLKNKGQDDSSRVGEKGEASKGLMPIQNTEKEENNTELKEKSPIDITNKPVSIDSKTPQATLSTSIKDDPMEVDKVEQISAVDDMKTVSGQNPGAVTSTDTQYMAHNSTSSEATRTSIPLSIKPQIPTSTAIVMPAPVPMATPQTKQLQSTTLAPTFKPDPLMDNFRREEEKIRRFRRALSSKRVRKKPETSIETNKKKRKRDSDKGNGIPGWKGPPLKVLNSKQEEEYMNASHKANETTERWIRQFRLCHESFWVEKERQEQIELQKQQHSFYLNPDPATNKICCRLCATQDKKRSSRVFAGDELMQCLECGFIGCSPPSLNSDSKYHMQQHLLISGHKFAVSCGEKAQLFCFECGDCVYHEVFEQEKIRIACTRKVPHMAWNDHAVLRSFDPFQFLKTQDSGIIWRGLVATYPPMVPKEHFCAAQLAMRRHALFEGKVDEKWILPKSNALYFAASQHLKKEEEKFKIAAPVGIFNLGNTCFMSAILQCLVFCKPLQQYFLRDSGHHFKSCEVFRHKQDVLTAAAATAAAAAAPAKKAPSKSKKSGNGPTIKKKSPKIESEVCLACEMDRLFLLYFGATTGNDAIVPLEESSRNLLLGNTDECRIVPLEEVVVPMEKGDPLIISDLLTSAWKSGDMNHLAGYDQRDAHEFLNSFLELLGKHVVKYRKRIYAAVTKVYTDNAFIPEPNLRDIGKFDSLLIVLHSLN